MHLCETKIYELCEKGCVRLPKVNVLQLRFSNSSLLEKHGVRLNVLGKRELLPAYVLKAIDKAESMTKHYDR